MFFLLLTVLLVLVGSESELDLDHSESVDIAIGGTTFEKDYYWTSSEYGADYGWYVHLGDGNVRSPDKGLAFRLRLMKDL